jgi:hypothetical protein
MQSSTPPLVSPNNIANSLPTQAPVPFGSTQPPTNLAHWHRVLAPASREPTDTIKFIAHAQVPKGRTVTYTHFCANICPQKEETHQCQITVGGDCIDYPGKVSTKMVGLTTIKLLLNSVVSKPKVHFMTTDVKNFYLKTPLKRPEYMRINIKLIPKEIIDKYQLTKLLHNDHIYVEINKGM